MTERRFYEQTTSDERRSAPAALRNVDHIIAVLEQWLPRHGTVLEVASGTGEHGIAFARHFPHLQWQPSDANPDALRSIAAWRAAEGSANLAAPLPIDVRDREWPIARADAVLSVNMVHISPWAAVPGLLEGAARLIGAGAPLILYGPWIEHGVAPAASNLAFDADLRRRDPEWGLREVEAFAAAAMTRGFDLIERRAMPANNLMLLLRRR
ncbi:MAG: class I SAM-dependent methyltransferase [Pseudomonadota bacterium]|nr:class I SAM-dependent methyltransferase [Pseudomonadota bacterium]